MISFLNDGGVTSPLGYQASAVVADIKGKGKGNLDLGLILSDTGATAVSYFTKNLVKASPVLYDIEVMKKGGKVSAIIANSGNANACTGVDGYNDCLKIVDKVAKVCKLKKDSILIYSTGVIGQRLVVDKIVKKVDELKDKLSDEGGEDFAKAILTTDTFKKEVAVIVTDSNAGSYCIGGATKGSGMIAPSLATMLTFITTDVEIDKSLLSEAGVEAIDSSFNSITVDSDMSTNDTVTVLANGMSGVKINKSNFAEFKKALQIVMLELAKLIVKDGEGATKFVAIEVEGARSKDDATLVATKISNSPLVKCMFAGSDPNWGRLLASAGASGAIFSPDKVDIYFNDLHYVKDSLIIDDKNEKEAIKIMKGNEYKIRINLNSGKSSKVFYTTDFTADYIKINADYRS